MRLTYHPGARVELLEIVRYYKRVTPALGERFSSDYDAAVKAIQDAPDRWPIIERDVRRHLLSHFPYGIYYRIHGDSLRILAIHHHRRDPDHWRSRTS